MLRRLLRPLRAKRAYRTLPLRARAEDQRDRRHGLFDDPGIDAAVAASLAWLGTAQDRSASGDGGVARHFSLLSGWSTSYPETTGYIVPTMLDRARIHGGSLEERGRRMLDWLVSIQLPDGAFQAGTIDASPVVPVTFNTGQILLGLAAGVHHFGDRYRQPMQAAADWLVRTQDGDGCWRKHPTPFAMKGEKAYETFVASSLFEAARLEPDSRYLECGVRSINWALSRQLSNGWFAGNCLSDPKRPLTHTIGYVLRGIVEAYLITKEKRFLDAALRCGFGVLKAFRPDGFLPARLDSEWTGHARYACLTGTVQIAHSWLLLYRETSDERLLRAAKSANRYVRRTVRIDGPPEIRGGVKGSFPVSAEYAKFEYPNWAAKFFIDANVAESEVSA